MLFRNRMSLYWSFIELLLSPICCTMYSSYTLYTTICVIPHYIIIYYKSYLKTHKELDIKEFHAYLPDFLWCHKSIGNKDFFPTFYDVLSEFHEATGLCDGTELDERN